MVRIVSRRHEEWYGNTGQWSLGPVSCSAIRVSATRNRRQWDPATRFARPAPRSHGGAGPRFPPKRARPLWSPSALRPPRLISTKSSPRRGMYPLRAMRNHRIALFQKRATFPLVSSEARYCLDRSSLTSRSSRRLAVRNDRSTSIRPRLRSSSLVPVKSSTARPIRWTS